MSDQEEQGTGTREAQAANLFDLRRIIGGLFVLYGVVLTIVGLGDSDAEIEKAAGVHINLWAGLGMLALGLFFIAWALLRPLGKQLQEEERRRKEREAS
jgi:xanthine/uracil/vitamin C permease (AzgA family)